MADLETREGGLEALSLHEQRSLLRVIRKCEEKGPAGIGQLVLPGPNGRNVTYVRVPGFFKAADLVGSETIRKRATFMEGICEMIGWGLSPLTRLLSRNKPLAEEAFTVAKLAVSTVTLSKDEALHWMGKMQLSWRQLVGFRQLIKSNDIALVIPSNLALKGVLEQYNCTLHFETLELTYGKIGSNKLMPCQVVTSSLFDVVCQDADQAWKEGTFVSANLVTNLERELRASYVIPQDNGGNESKWLIHSIDRVTPCSVSNQRRFASCAPLRADDSRKPDEHEPNFRKVVANVDGLYDLGRSMVLVKVGPSHTIVPEHIIPDVWSCTVGDNHAFCERVWGVGTPGARAEQRSSLLRGSATLVVCGGRCLGVQSGDITFPFRTAVDMIPNQCPDVSTMPIDLFYSGDLLSCAVIF
ncbi:MAG: hypothetical protein JW384_03087 [Nitrosomonadaceae bacterium]|nr:hypothetical protein [Nitrosomonadaceae bacterium]